ncbi:efflux RND transporter periplasmic adaptor subunit [Stenotrophomonas sp. ISL-67]|uniref:efflux RND transporter periplasmic adaptor subunit n=1 Tax=Stenotrophomonas sp. ISL-67 TaxID=2819171 RepID=UPI001BE992AC|nr:efflux RND transporter periplasmic adaptor subunit [Stenotrophomonas sp. ISL-67]MBT2767802.1 efflux RND transporter periplasmic adaptor subunit [Stenotrophomonas sp. ISL-67]
MADPRPHFPSRRHWAASLPPIPVRMSGRSTPGFKVLLAALALIVAILATVALLRPAGHAGAAQSNPVEMPAAMTVSTVRVERKMWTDPATATGAIVPWQESVVGAPMAGLRLASVEADVGDVVRKGQVLARFDDALLQADANRLAAVVAQADAAAAQASRDARRAEQLRPSGALSEQSLLQALTDAESAAAAVRAARAALNAKHVEIGYTLLRAADDGVISERVATLGAVPERGEALFRLIRQQRLEWRGELDAAQLARVTAGQHVQLQLPDGSTAQARVRQLAPGLAQATRLGLVHADIEQGSTARAGMYVEGSLGQARTPALVVPAASVVIRDGHSRVFTLHAGAGYGHASAREVVVARRREGQVEIASGLEQGEWIVEEGAGFLTDGDRVQIVPRTPDVT